VAPDGNSYNETKWQFQKAKKYYTNLLPHGFNYDFEFDLNRSFFSKALNVALEIPYPKIDLQKSKKTTVIISPGASAEFRRWSTQKFIEVIRAILITNPKQEILISGAPSEKPLGKAIKSSFANIANVKNACGTMRLSELCVELANCSLLISNESGVVHLAKAVGVPLIYCISNGNHYGRFNPYPSSDKRLVLRYFYPPSFQEAIDANKQKALEKYYWGSRISIDGIKPSVIINALRIDLNS
jgi:ADP-heptose:LPS heptosyltransferase